MLLSHKDIKRDNFPELQALSPMGLTATPFRWSLKILLIRRSMIRWGLPSLEVKIHSREKHNSFWCLSYYLSPCHTAFQHVPLFLGTLQTPWELTLKHLVFEWNYNLEDSVCLGEIDYCRHLYNYSLLSERVLVKL